MFNCIWGLYTPHIVKSLELASPGLTNGEEGGGYTGYNIEVRFNVCGNQMTDVIVLVESRSYAYGITPSAR